MCSAHSSGTHQVILKAVPLRWRKNRSYLSPQVDDTILYQYSNLGISGDLKDLHGNLSVAVLKTSALSMLSLMFWLISGGR